MTYSSRSFTVPKIASQIGNAPLYETLNDIVKRSADFANEIVGEVNDAKIGGTGTAGYLPYFLTGKSLGASPAYTDGTNIGIGMTPTYKLDVNGAVRGTNIYDTALTSGYLPKAGTGGLLGDSKLSTDGTNFGIDDLTYAGRFTINTTGTLSDKTVLILRHPYSATSAWTGQKIRIGYSSVEEYASEIIGYSNAASTYASRLLLRTHHPNPGQWNAGVLIDEWGNVGIGTTSPLARAVISNGGAEGFEVDPLSTAGLVYLTGYNRSGAAYVELFHRASVHSFGVSSAKALKIDSSSGQVVIGGTSAAAGRLLDVNGIIKATDIQLTTGASNGYVLTSDASGNASWQAGVAGMTYKGTWNANTNTPTLADGTGTAGDTYAVTVGGTQFGRTFVAGGWCIYNGSIWEPVGTSVSVTSVNGLTGAVSLSLASSAFVNQGTTTTVLHGNAAGNPSWSAVSLAADVSGTLPVANLPTVTVPYGGTGLTSLTAGRIPFGNGTSAFGSAAGLVWDSVNNRLGVGTPVGGWPGDDIHIFRNSGTRACLHVQADGGGGSTYAALKLSTVYSGALIPSEWLVTAGNTIAGFEIRDSNAGATRLSISNSTGVVDAPQGYTVGGSTVWNAANDGAGSGLDADLLDGNHAAAFATSGHTHAGLLSGLTAGRVPYATSATALADDAGMVYDASTDRLTTGIWDKGGAVYNVLAYGADPTGAVDATTWIQNALDAASAAGGGVVLCPPGTYKILGRLNIPTQVTLTGNDSGWKWGSRGAVLNLSADSGSPSATAIITVNDDAALMNVAIAYPGQTDTNPPVQYPFAVRMGPISRVENVWFEWCYQGIDVGWTSWGYGYASGAVIRNVRGHFLNTGVAIDRAADLVTVENLSCLQAGTTNLNAYQWANAVALKTARVDGLYVRNFFAICYLTGIQMLDNGNGTSYGHISYPHTDMCRYGIRVTSNHQNIGVTIMGWLDSQSSSAGTPRYSLWSEANAGAPNNVTLTGCHFWNSGYDQIYWNNVGVLSVQNCRFDSWYASTSPQVRAIDCVGGHIRIEGNYFEPFGSGNECIRLQASVGRAVVIGNDLGGHPYTNSCGTSVWQNNLA